MDAGQPFLEDEHEPGGCISGAEFSGHIIGGDVFESVTDFQINGSILFAEAGADIFPCGTMHLKRRKSGTMIARNIFISGLHNRNGVNQEHEAR